ncbi:methyl-accepting chemotaxis protein [Evansella tamaricis]|uniref:Methyl-accepting chemotaxis protein n=1 Tax=Evansella tamaricis TaxID=2069301 RepID=A0ABS6JJI0_9BACI|nr:methyl-accepting chemotaxis protein [Evansella tamaricis]MBU9712972.1 methyl-accepting chemotaxis protein [Evansella tamaricis]
MLKKIKDTLYKTKDGLLQLFRSLWTYLSKVLKKDSRNKRADSNKVMTLKTKLILSFIFYAIIPSVIVASIVFSVSRNAIEVQVADMSYEIGAQLTYNIDNLLADADNLLSEPYTNRELLDYLSIDPNQVSSIDLLEIRQWVGDFFNPVVRNNTNIDNLFFVRNDGTLYGSNNSTVQSEDFLTDEIINAISDNRGQSVWFHGLHGDYENIFVLRNMRNTSGNDIGVLVLSFNRQIFDTVFNLSESESNFFIVGSDSTIVASNNQEEVGQSYLLSEMDQSENILSVKEASNGWQVIISTSKSYLMSEINNVVTFIYLIVGVFVLIAVAGGFLITISITKPINNLVILMKKGETGDLTVRTGYVLNNEIGQLGSSFNQMLANIKDIIENNKKASQLAVESAENLKDISINSSFTSEQIAAAIEEVAKGAVEQVDYAEKTKKVMQGLSNEMNIVSDNVIHVSEAMSSTKALSSTSIHHVKELTDKNEDVGKKLQKVDETIVKLNSSVNEVKGIVKLIKDMSEQTNLLSLNASIEAARAGDAGRGFAVVAGEVRKLAEQSKGATIKVDHVIQKILGHIEESVLLVKDSLEVFSEQTEVIQTTSDSFEKIIDTTGSIIEEMSLVNSSMDKMNLAKEQVSKAVSEMVMLAEVSSSTTQEITATTEEQAAAAEQLGQLSEKLVSTMMELDSLINKFKV